MKMKTVKVNGKAYTCYIDDINIKVDEKGMHVALKDVYDNIFNGYVKNLEVK